MNQHYSPVIKGKLNDIKALSFLAPPMLHTIRPLVELLPLPSGGDIADHIDKFSHYVAKHLSAATMMIDMYGVRPGEELSDGTSAVIYGYKNLLNRGIKYTPVYGFDRDNNLWSKLTPIIKANARGLCFRLDSEDVLDQPEETWQKIIERTSYFQLKSTDIDIHIDLRSLDGADLQAAKEGVLDFLDYMPRNERFRSVIVAGSSALKDVSRIAKDSREDVFRSELALWADLQADLSGRIALSYSDYGVLHPDFVEGIRNPHVNAKVRYTSGQYINYYRGHGLHRPTKDYDQYRQLAESVRSSSEYLGPSFSYGDKYVDSVADHHTTPGSLSTWVLADMNHHLAVASTQMTRAFSASATSQSKRELILVAAKA